MKISSAFSILASALAVITALPSTVQSRPPDTLDFGFIKYAKKLEMLFRDPVRHVLINDAGSKPFPYALLFDAKIVFLNKRGSIISESVLPSATYMKAGESQNSKYILVYGHIADSKYGFVRVFDNAGQLLYAADSVEYHAQRDAPLPLEKPVRLLSAGGPGEIIIDGLDESEPPITEALFTSENYEDGETHFALSSKANEFLTVVNKYQIPTGKPEDNPEFHRIDGDLRRIASMTLPYLLIDEIGYFPRSQFCYVKAELEDGKNQMIILDLNGNEHHRFPGGSILRFAARANLFLQVQRSGKPTLIDATSWESVRIIEKLTARFPWVDAAISPDGRYSLFYNDDELAIFETRGNRLAKLSFPYSFKRCFISEKGGRIILAGDFGFVVYDLSR
jgi:hypothetical protein